MEKKKKLLFWLIVAIAVIAVIMYAHYVPVWASLSNVLCVAGGAVAGWFVHVFYTRYINPPKA